MYGSQGREYDSQLTDFYVNAENIDTLFCSTKTIISTPISLSVHNLNNFILSPLNHLPTASINED